MTTSKIKCDFSKCGHGILDYSKLSNLHVVILDKLPAFLDTWTRCTFPGQSRKTPDCWQCLKFVAEERYRYDESSISIGVENGSGLRKSKMAADPEKRILYDILVSLDWPTERQDLVCSKHMHTHITCIFNMPYCK